MIFLQDNPKKKNSSFFNKNPQIVPQPKTSIFSAASTANNTNINSQIIPKKIESPIDFIKQKKKYIIQDIFDIKGSKDFIKSKELAMKEIKLYDEIIFEEKKEKREKKEKKNKLSNPLLSELKSKIYNNSDKKVYKKGKRKTSENIRSENNIENKKYQSEIEKSNTKKKKSKNKDKDIYNNKCKNIENNKDLENNIFIIDKKSNYSKDSNFFYKFIIDNADDSEEKFNQKLEKVFKKARVKEQPKSYKEKTLFNKALTNKKIEEDKRMIKYNSAKMCKKDNIFVFSEQTKNLMTNDNIDVSSISSTYRLLNTVKVNINNNKFNEKKDNNSNYIIFDEKEKNFINNPNKDSLISILDNMVRKSNN